jgi:branched-chain amino acid transport system ATP-binding protein
MNLLEVTGITAGYGAATVLHDVSLTVPEGALVALVGTNGAGKTTLLRTISGLLRPRAGTIRFRGEAIDRTPPDAIVDLGVVQVPEGRRLFVSMSVLENLLIGASSAASRPHRQQSLDQVFTLFPKLSERRHQSAGTLSGGEQQMVAIGRALMARPQLLLLDETSLGLAPVVVDQIFDRIAVLARSGLTILLVEQNTALALEAASYAFVLEHGAVVLHGAAAALARDDRVRQAYLGI